MAQKRVACGCKRQRRYEITSCCNTLLESARLKQTFFLLGGSVQKQDGSVA